MFRIYIAITCLFCLFLFSGCILNHAVEGDAGTCEVHGNLLHKSIVRVKYGAYCALGTHLGKGSEAFPNAKHPICGGCTVRAPYSLIYNCSKCNRAKRHFFFSKENRSDDAKIRAKF